METCEVLFYFRDGSAIQKNCDIKFLLDDFKKLIISENYLNEYGMTQPRLNIFIDPEGKTFEGFVEKNVYFTSQEQSTNVEIRQDVDKLFSNDSDNVKVPEMQHVEIISGQTKSEIKKETDAFFDNLMNTSISKKYEPYVQLKETDVPYIKSVTTTTTTTQYTNIQKINDEKIEISDDINEFYEDVPKTINKKKFKGISVLDNISELNSIYDKNGDMKHNLKNINLDDKYVIFDTNEYISKILLSYNYSLSKIYDQMKHDFSRMEICLNGRKIKSMSFLINRLKRYNGYEYIGDGFTFKLHDILIMLCNQSSYAFPFVVMNTIYSDDKKKFVFSNKTRINIIEQLSSNIIKVDMDCSFDIKNISSNKKLNTIDSHMELTACLRVKNVFQKYASLIWNLS